MNADYRPWHEIVKLAVKHIGKRAVYLSNGLEYQTKEEDVIWTFVQLELRKLYGISEDTPASQYPVAYLNTIVNVLHSGIFFFESEKEQYKFFDIFNQEPVYASAIFACVYNEHGECEMENT